MRRRPAIGTATVAALIVGLGIAGCGGSSDSDSAPPFPKREFVFIANGICQTGNQQLNAAERKAFGKGKPSQAEFASFVNTTFAPNVQKQIDDIRGVGPPDGGEQTVSHILDLAQQDLDKVKADPSLLLGKSDPFASFKKVAHPYGMTKCAAGS